MSRMPQFAPGFLWGASTSSYQIEGAPTADGKGTSIWDTFCHTPGKVLDGQTGDVACDHYRRWSSDLDLLPAVGCNAYRFSISWPRILPAGRGRVEQRGLDFYDKVVDGLLERGIAAFATLYHWDLPQALQDAGGWYSRATAEAFAEYAGVVAHRIGDRVSAFITLNEPGVHVSLGHVLGTHAPGTHDLERVYWVIHHLMLGHGLAAQAVRSACETPVGVANNHAPILPQDSSERADILAAERMDLLFNRQYLDPLLIGSNPADIEELYGPLAGQVVHDGDLAIIGSGLDFLGVNYYNPQWVKAGGPDNSLGFQVVDAPADYLRTAFGWPVAPENFTDVLLRLDNDYRLPPVYITENGASWPEPVHDQFRIDFLDAHIRAVARAIDDGMDIRGFFCWSLMDNFEWAQGTSQKFGLVGVDFQTQRRTIRDSGRWFADLAAGRL